MSSSTSAPAGHEKYYVPESSSLAVRATIGLVLSVFGAYGERDGCVCERKTRVVSSVFDVD